VAEVSSNHHRDLERCLEFIRTAAEIGCEAVKFQLFRVRELFAPRLCDTIRGFWHARPGNCRLSFYRVWLEAARKRESGFRAPRSIWRPWKNCCPLWILQGGFL